MKLTDFQKCTGLPVSCLRSLLSSVVPALLDSQVLENLFPQPAVATRSVVILSLSEVPHTTLLDPRIGLAGPLGSLPSLCRLVEVVVGIFHIQTAVHVPPLGPARIDSVGYSYCLSDCLIVLKSIERSPGNI